MKITRKQLRRLIKEELSRINETAGDGKVDTIDADVLRKVADDLDDLVHPWDGGRVRVDGTGGTAVVDFLDDEIYAGHKTKISAAASGDPKIKAVREFLVDLIEDLHEEEILRSSEDPKIADELKRLGDFLDDIIDDYDGKDDDTQGAWAEKGLSVDYLFLVGKFVDSPRESLRQELWKVEHKLGR